MTTQVFFARAVVVCALICGSYPVIAQSPPSPPSLQTSPSSPSKPPVNVVPAADDEAIARRLEGILDSTGWFIEPQVTVRHGVVALDGKTRAQEHKLWAGDLAEKTQDVVAVVNRIAVESDVGSTFGRAGEEVTAVFRAIVQSWPLIVLSLVILVVTWLVAKLASILACRFFSRRVTSPLLLAVITRAFSIPVFVLGLYFILQVAGLTRLALTVLGGTGLIGIVLGFAFRDIAENFLASLLLSVRNPFHSGDLVEVAGHMGIVKNLNTRSTVLLTLDGSHVQIPNATVYKSTIENFSSNPTRRANFGIGIGYDSSAATAQKLISAVLRDHPAVLESPEPLVLVEELGDATVNLRVSYWFDSAIHSPAKINSALLRQAKNVLLRSGIELPDPAREIVFPKGIPVTMLKDATTHAPAKPPDRQVRSPMPDDAIDATDGEGDLSNEAQAIRDSASSIGHDDQVNLLKR
jgi:small conductance mechanosensitive channel